MRQHLAQGTRAPAGPELRLVTLPVASQHLGRLVTIERQQPDAQQRYVINARPAAALEMVLAPLVILPFDEAALWGYGDLRAELERKGTPIGSLDTMIAAHALSRKSTLVTNNTREFARVPGLALENWVQSA